MSWKCPGNVLDMSLGWGHVLKFQGQNWTTSCFFAEFAQLHVHSVSLESVMCPLFHLEQKNLQINQIFWICTWKTSLIPLCNLSFLNSYFGITSPIFITNWKQMRCQETFCFAKTKNALQSKLYLPPPLCPSWYWQKCTFFIVSFLTKIVS